jgi:hypothetical protein
MHRPPPPPIPYASRLPLPAASPRTHLSWLERVFFGVVLPVVLLGIGWFAMLSRLNGKGEGAGFAGMYLLFFGMPFAIMIASVLNGCLLLCPCRRRLTAFVIGLVVPLAILTVEFHLVDRSLPQEYRLLK